MGCGSSADVTYPTPGEKPINQLSPTSKSINVISKFE